MAVVLTYLNGRLVLTVPDVAGARLVFLRVGAFTVEFFIANEFVVNV